MKALEEKILREGTVLPGNILKVGSFLNHQLDVGFIMEMGEEIARLFENSGATRILTIETSGIAIAVGAAAAMKLPVVFAKKNRPPTFDCRQPADVCAALSGYLSNRPAKSREAHSFRGNRTGSPVAAA